MPRDDRQRLRHLAASGDQDALRALKRVAQRKGDALEALTAETSARDDAPSWHVLEDRFSALRDDDPEVRALAVDEISSLRLPEDVAMRLYAMVADDPSVPVRIALVRGLSRVAHGCRDQLPIMLDSLLHDSTWVRDEAAAALVSWAPPKWSSRWSSVSHRLRGPKRTPRHWWKVAEEQGWTQHPAGPPVRRFLTGQPPQGNVSDIYQQVIAQPPSPKDFAWKILGLVTLLHLPYESQLLILRRLVAWAPATLLAVPTRPMPTDLQAINTAHAPLIAQSQGSHLDGVTLALASAPHLPTYFWRALRWQLERAQQVDTAGGLLRTMIATASPHRLNALDMIGQHPASWWAQSATHVELAMWCLHAPEDRGEVLAQALKQPELDIQHRALLCMSRWSYQANHNERYTPIVPPPMADVTTRHALAIQALYGAPHPVLNGQAKAVLITLVGEGFGRGQTRALLGNDHVARRLLDRIPQRPYR